ncbi:MAG: cation:proton antiporter subunit C [Firmicutes bacterium]|jgi:multicomponent Na+:H+ antiporter subunit C|nr:cation:proton antiporter subunit C [Bacillota bacterium]
MNIDITLAFIVFVMGVYGVARSRNIVKTIIFINVVQSAVILIFILLSKNAGSGIPIVGIGKGQFVDPLPQALMITTIVIGAAITAVTLMLSIKIFHYYGTLDWEKIFKKEE